MKNSIEQQLKFRIKYLIIFFMIALVLSGITAFPLVYELTVLHKLTQNGPLFLHNWIDEVYEGVKEIDFRYPYMFYGTDWLAFAHIVIAVAFIGPLKDPVKNIWVIQFGMIACTMIIPLALICGSMRGIPFYWRLIDCSFGIIGFIPLYICNTYIKKLEKIIQHNK